MDEYKIKTEAAGVAGVARVFVEWRNNNDLHLRLEVDGIVHERIDRACLEAFNFLRSACFPDVVFLCNGARPNFVQSGMIQQSGGFYGYIVSMGERSSLDKTGFIFDYCPRELTATVEEQRAFKLAWHNSLNG